jgi:hypothetical protein
MKQTKNERRNQERRNQKKRGGTQIDKGEREGSIKTIMTMGERNGIGNK